MALVGKDQPLSASDVSFNIYAPEEDGAEERAIVVSNAPAGRIIGLNAGTYHVVCRYGDANAVVRADIRVEAGKLTEAAMYQKAARLTLKLVSEHGGEALANTAWSVVTSAGETVAGSVGAFPSVVLAAGEYTAIAKHDGKIYERTFTVEPGLNRDMEVLATAENIVPPVPPGGIPAPPTPVPAGK
jgi:ketopantoate hydroxymethyltransferase